MDDVSARFGEMAEAFSAGWLPEWCLLEFGNLAVPEHVAAIKGARASTWTPLLNEFIERYVFDKAFVLIGEVYSYDTARAIFEMAKRTRFSGGINGNWARDGMRS